MTYPNKDEIFNILEEIESKEKMGDAVFSKEIPENASPVDKMKFNICQNILKFKIKKNFSNVDMGKLLNVNPSVVSRIIHCHIEKFKLDILLEYYQIILISLKDPNLLESYEKRIDELFLDDFLAS